MGDEGDDARPGLRHDMSPSESEHRFRALIHNISDTVSVIDAQARVLYSTGEASEVLGWPVDSWQGRNVFELGHPDELEAGAAILAELVADPGGERTAVFRMLHAEGHYDYISVTGHNLLHDPAVGGIVITSRNVDEHLRATMLMTAQATVLELIATNAPLDDILAATAVLVDEQAETGGTVVLVQDGDHLVPRAGARLPSPVVRALTSEEPPAPFAAATDPDSPVLVPDVTAHPGLADLAHADGGQASLWLLAVTGPDGERVGVIGVLGGAGGPDPRLERAARVAGRLVGIALDRHVAITRLAHQAVHDHLTGLPNRTLALDRLEHAIDRSEGTGEGVAVLFVDLDRFKVVNDSLGHVAGDELLVEFAERLRSLVRPQDTIARIGGDEFVVVAEPPDSMGTATAVAGRVAQALTEPFSVAGGAEVFVTASIGLATGTDLPAETLLAHADAAMYRAKERGRNRTEEFDHGMRAAAQARLELHGALARALGSSQFTVLHQPVVDVAGGRIVGSEALVRWEHPERGRLGPDEFIALSEESGLIVPLGEYVLDRALEQASALVATRPGEPFTQSVNLSVRQLSSADLASKVEAALQAHDWPPELLCLELTETVLLDDLDQTLAQLRRLKDMGVKLAIDDFGTGYSSLTYLQRFPVDIVKVDRSFVSGLSAHGRRFGDDRGTIVTAVVGMAHALGLEVCAEGVENTDQLRVLTDLGCDLAQGFLFAPPLAADELAARMAADVQALRG